MLFILKLMNERGCPRGCHGREIAGFIIRLIYKLISSEEGALEAAREEN